jgi:hypothetical protein
MEPSFPLRSGKASSELASVLCAGGGVDLLARPVTLRLEMLEWTPCAAKRSAAACVEALTVFIHRPVKPDLPKLCTLFVRSLNRPYHQTGSFKHHETGSSKGIRSRLMMYLTCLYAAVD